MSRTSSRTAVPIEQPPEGLTRRALLNVLETFFRKPVLYLLPVFLLTALGVMTAMNSSKEYQSTGVLNASAGSLLNEITEQSRSYGFERPSTVTARNINNLLRTSVFLGTVIQLAELDDEVDNGFLTTDQIRSAISARASGDTLVAVSATTQVPELSQALASGTLRGFVEYVKSQDIADAQVRYDTYQSLYDANVRRLQEAEQELEDYLLAHPEDANGERPITEELEVDRLSTAQRRAEDAIQATQTDLTDATLARDVASTVVDRQLRILDEPGMPGAPTSGVRDKVMTVGIFFVLGAALSLAFVVLAAVLDRSVRLPSDISSKFGLEVLGVVPSATRS
jgi:capsular polysaccharide biosynthesis protein